MRFLRLAVLGCLFFHPVLKGEEPSSDEYRIAKVNIELTNERGETDSTIGDQVEKARYQRMLESSRKYSGLRYRIFWKGPAASNLTLKLDARGLNVKSGKETYETLSQPISERKGGWTSFDIQGDMLKSLGQPMAWKLSILQNGHLLAERKSFTWAEGVVQPPPPAAEPLSENPPPAATAPSSESGPSTTQEASPLLQPVGNEKPENPLPSQPAVIPVSNESGGTPTSATAPSSESNPVSTGQPATLPESEPAAPAPSPAPPPDAAQNPSHSKEVPAPTPTPGETNSPPTQEEPRMPASN